MPLHCRTAVVCVALFCAGVGVRAQVPTLTEPVGSSSGYLVATVTITTAGMVNAANVLTLGAPNQDFNLAIVPGGATCFMGTTFSPGDRCTIVYTFKPTHPGLRFGGISLFTSSGVLMGNTYVNGLGTGPQVTYSPPAQSLLGGFYSYPTGVAVDGAGDVFLTDESGNAVYEITNGVSRLIGTFAAPDDVSVDGSGNVFVIYNRTNLAEIQAVNGVIPNAPAVNVLLTNFTGLNGMKVDGNGNVYVAEGFAGTGAGNMIQEVLAVNGSIPANPTVQTLVSGVGEPTGVAVDKLGNVYFSDQLGNAYEAQAVGRSIPANPTIVTLASGLNTPTNIALDAAGDVFVSVQGGVSEIVAVNGVIPSNPTVLQLGKGIVFAQGLAVDASGNVYIADDGTPEAVKLDFADAPSLSFATAPVGVTSADSPQTVSLINDGNTNLGWSSIAGTTNPTITAGFTFTSTCPVIASGSAIAYALVPGSSCAESISFKPVVAGPDSGKFTLTDNNLNVIGAQQNILLNGTGIAQDFSLTANPASITIETQHHGTMQLTLTSIGSFAGPVQLSCQGPLPPYVTCELPANETLTAGQMLNFNFTMDTDQILNFLAKETPARESNASAAKRVLLALLLPLTLTGFVRRRKALRRVLLLAVLVVGATGLTACGNKWPQHTPPGTYTIPVVGTGVAPNGTVITHTLNITLTVTP